MEGALEIKEKELNQKLKLSQVQQIELEKSQQLFQEYKSIIIYYLYHIFILFILFTH